MRAGRRNRRVIIQEAAETRTDQGGVTRIWSTYATRWAAKQPLMGREHQAAQQVRPEQQYRFRFGWDLTLSLAAEGMRIVSGDDIFNIIGIQVPESARDEIVMMTIKDADMIAFPAGQWDFSDADQSGHLITIGF